MEAQDISLRGVPETMLQTLYARAKESQKPNHAIYDEKAMEIARLLKYDFSLADKDLPMHSGVIARTLVLDKLVTEFLAAHSDAVVLNLACGLDTRCCRMQGFSRWYNLDLPETMEVRRRFFTEEGSTFQIAASAMDSAWPDAVETNGAPVLAVIEGLTMYLQQADVQTIFAILASRFPGLTVLVETMNPLIAKHLKEKSIAGSQAKFTWGVRDGETFAKLVPGYTHIKDISLTEGMQAFAPVYKVLGKIGFVRRLSNQILVLHHEVAEKS